jgi:16S rRNA (guanine527-N7)-methyltransferase
MKISEQQIVDRVQPLLPEGEPFPGDWPKRLETYLDLLWQWNTKVNLVSRRSADRLLDGQLVPSLAALLEVPPQEPLRVLDVGSGGGFPGIPLAILRPNAQVDLVDATRKKCDFLQVAAAAIGLTGTEVHWCRIEAPAPALQARAPFDVGFGRALGTPERVGAAAKRLLRKQGRFWIFVPPGTPGSRAWPPAGPPVTGLLPI